MKTSFSKHGWHRVRDRLSLGPRAVADLLDWDLAVDIGVEPGANIVHRLFFSAPDNMCFVAIQNRVAWVVITVLPVDFYESRGWCVSLDARKAARRLACPVGIAAA